MLQPDRLGDPQYLVCLQAQAPLRMSKTVLQGPLGVFGDIGTVQRLQEEVASSNTVVPWIALVGAWCRKPLN